LIASSGSICTATLSDIRPPSGTP